MKKIGFLCLMLMLFSIISSVSAQVNVGDIITFGHYEQDNELSSGPEPIEWQVLAAEPDRVLVISKYGLDAKPFNVTDTPSMTWEKCSLRMWLNGEFYNSAFSAAEQKRISQVTVKNPDNPEYGTTGGNDTEDRIFLLSIDEAEWYFASDTARQCQATAYAIANGGYVNKNSGYSIWNLRSPGIFRLNIAYVDQIGLVSTVGGSVSDFNELVRPALWLDPGEGTAAGITAEDAEESGAGVEEASADPAKDDYAIGQIITFGRYEQDNNMGNGAEAVEWQVLAAEGDRVLVISRYGLDVKPYNKLYSPVTWETSSLREWLNGDFYNSAFSASEQIRIHQVTVKTPDDPYTGTPGGNDTVDWIFLLSTEEVARYFETESARQCRPTAYAEANGAWVSGNDGNSNWWLRSPGFKRHDATYISNFGSVGDGHFIYYTDVLVRPALWLDISHAEDDGDGPQAALAAPSQIPAPVFPTDTVKPEASIPANLQVGDTFKFGHYEQDNNLNSGAEAIEWEVLAAEGDSVLVISRYGLDAKQYNSANFSETWETSSLREWLNGEFYNSVFNASEQARIRQMTVKNPDNPEYGTQGGNDTEDRIFLLSIEEVNRYFGTDTARQCKATAYAEANGAWVSSSNGYSWYWLRTPGIYNNTAAYIRDNGYVLARGDLTVCTDILVRPALWLNTSHPEEDLSASRLSPEPTTELKPAVTISGPDLVDMKAGDTFLFGHYEQDNNLSNGAEAIEWQVLAAEEDRMLVVSRYGLEVKPYNAEWIGVTWETSSLREWLNGEFYNSAFSAAELEQILQVTVKNPDNPGHDTPGGNDTADRIFLLSIDEAKKYFGSDTERQCRATAYAEANGAYVYEGNSLNGIFWWWLRSPGYFPESAAYVFSDGDVISYGCVDVSTGVLVRPAFWMSIGKTASPDPAVQGDSE